MELKYMLIDYYEGVYTVGMSNDLIEIDYLATNWDEDTDGECTLVLNQLNEVTGVYEAVDDWTY